MSLKVWMNGELVAGEDAKIGVYDHGLLYGDGVFEGIRTYGGKVFRLEEHLERLYKSAEAIRLARRACAAPPECDPAILDTLAAAYAAAGRFDAAVSTASGAADRAERMGKLHDASEFRARLSLYRQGRPYVDPGSKGEAP